MDKSNINKRLTELGIYNDYYYRRELKALPQLLKDKEQINCIFTGVHEANRKMVVVTGTRLIIIFAPNLGAGQIESVGLGAVKSTCFEKHFLFSKVTIVTDKKEFVFTGVQRARKEQFERAVGQKAN